MADGKALIQAWRLFTDGAAKGNPGPAGAGWILFEGKDTEPLRESRFLGTATNNEAEYQALILGLQRALERGAERIRIHLDSELLVRQLNGIYRVKNPRLLLLHRRVRELLKKFSEYVIIHVPREENREADRMANEAVKKSKEFRVQSSE